MTTDIENKKIGDMTGAEARKIMTTAVWNGVLIAGLVLLILNVVAGVVIASMVHHSADKPAETGY